MTLAFYSPAPRPDDEAARQRAVAAIDPGLWQDDARLAAIVGMAARTFGTPMAALSVLDGDRQRFMARIGLPPATPRAVAFCGHVVTDPDRMLVVRDAAADARFAGNPLVRGTPNIRFYAGAVIRGVGGQPLGALCVIDDRVHGHVPDSATAALRRLAAEASTLIAPGASVRPAEPGAAEQQRAR